MITVILLGAGKLASQLYKAFQKSDKIKLVQRYNRSIKHIEHCRNEVSITDNLTELSDADLYIMAVKDDAIGDLSKRLPFKHRLVAHTSGSVSIHELDKKHKRAVFYPLQTFSSDSELDFSEVPICIEAIDKKDAEVLKNFSKILGCSTYKINTDQRFRLHLAAVFVNNFVNQMYRIGHELSDAKNINFDILKPLILETAKKVQYMSPFQAQTGPAVRNDKKTIKKQLKMLEDKTHKQIYELMTKSIKDTHGR